MKQPENMRPRENQPESIDEVLDFLKEAKDKYSNEIPDEIVHGPNPEGGQIYKAQKNWFYAVVYILELVKTELTSRDLDIPDWITAFMSEYTSEKFHKKPRTEKGDIDKADNILEACIKLLKDLKK